MSLRSTENVDSLRSTDEQRRTGDWMGGLTSTLGRLLAPGRPDDSSGAGSVGETGDPGGPRLSFYIPSLAVGGAEQVTVSIVNGLAERGYDIDLAVSHPDGELLSNVANDVTVTRLGASRVPVAGIGAHVPSLAKYLHRTEPAAVFTQKLDASVVCLLANRIADVDTKIIPTVHSAFGMTSDPTVKSRALDSFATRSLAAADHVVAVSEGVADSVVEATTVRPEDVSVLHNPVDVESVRRRSQNPVESDWVENDDVELVLFVGRLERQKDLETWLRAFARLHESRPTARGVIAGKGSQRDSLLSLAERLGVGDVVSIPGYVDNPYRYMQKADVFLLSSRFEGLPTVLIEALACGCQIVATDCPCGPREILSSGEFGRLAPVGDANALAEGVEEALADPVATESLEDRADDFAPDVVLDDYERFVESRVYQTP